MSDAGALTPGQPMAAAPHEPADRRTDGLVQLWSVTLPRRLEAWAPRLADALADGAWTAIWPRVTAYAPIVAFIGGFGVAIVLPLTPGDYGAFSGVPRVWSELLPFMMVVIAVGVFSGAAGIGLLAGYVAGDVLWLAIGAMTGGWASWFVLNSNPLIAVLQVAGSALISYLLLAIPAVTLPMVVRRLAARAPLRRISNPRLRTLAWAATYLVAAGVLTFLWTLAAVVLIRPVFTWRSGSPAVQAIEPVQFQWEWLVGAAVIAALVRITLQELVVRRSERASRVAVLQAQRSTDAGHRALSHGAGPVLAIVATVGGLILLLAGTYEDFIDPVVVLVAGALLVAWRAGMIGARSTGWGQRIEGIPAPARLAVVLIVGYLVATVVAEAMWATDSLRPVLIGILLTGALFVLLFPTTGGARESQHVDAT